MTLIEELEKLNALHAGGSLSDEEFQKAKDALLASHQSAGQKFKQTVDEVSSDDNAWGVLIHLSQFCGYVLPLGGWIVPIALWLIKRSSSREIDLHGRIVMNWLLSEIIYGVLFGLLCFILIGFPFLIALGIVAFVYPIVGAIKASNGEIWNYPGSIRFFSLD